MTVDAEVGPLSIRVGLVCGPVGDHDDPGVTDCSDATLGDFDGGTDRLVKAQDVPKQTTSEPAVVIMVTREGEKKITSGDLQHCLVLM